jgi:glucuronoarabinoxylan endo-1,4-beta-xylanase
LTGSGTVHIVPGEKSNQLVPVYLATPAPAGCYQLATLNGQIGFYRISAGSEPIISPFSAYLDPDFTGSASWLPLNLTDTAIKQPRETSNQPEQHLIYDLNGRLIDHPIQGIYLRNVKKYKF